MILYHGSPIPIKEPKNRLSPFTKDFGPGFYCTSIRKQAERWAMRWTIRRNSQWSGRDTSNPKPRSEVSSPSPIVTVFEYTENHKSNTLEFSELTEEWLDFIACCRRGIPHNYDTVIGPMANDQVWNYIADFASGILTREQFWVLAKFKFPTPSNCILHRKILGTNQIPGKLRSQPMNGRE
ncbi:MAG: DUF3990 domain-containing protein, partial [Polyangiaceae bacterium]|nr:DUF3990 domain-containing protein [Polyangiaceae bacterium]